MLRSSVLSQKFAWFQSACKARFAGNGKPFPRIATQQWRDKEGTSIAELQGIISDGKLIRIFIPRGWDETLA